MAAAQAGVISAPFKSIQNRHPRQPHLPRNVPPLPPSSPKLSLTALLSARGFKLCKIGEVCSNPNFPISPVIFRVHFAEHKVLQDAESATAETSAQVKSRITENQTTEGLRGHYETGRQWRAWSRGVR